MSTREEALHLLENLSKGRIERRDFVRQALGLGLSFATIGSLLSACGSPEQKKAPPAPRPTEAPSPRAVNIIEIPKPESELVFHNWPDYIAEDTVSNFEKEFGVKVTFATYENNDEILDKIEGKKSGIDVICPSGYAGQAAISNGLIEKLNLDWIPNSVNLAPQFRSTDTDPNNEYTIPWLWGRTGIGYRKDKITTPVDSWAAFLNPELRGKMTMMDDMRDVLGSWLKFRGKSVNSVNIDDLAQAQADAIAAKKLIKGKEFVSTASKKMLIAGDVWMIQLWDGDIFDAQTEEPNIEWVMPKEGGSFWIDSLMIPKNAPHPKAAHAFMNYVLRAEVGAAISNTTGYGSPNTAAQDKITKPVPFPTAAQARILEIQKDLGAGNQLWEKVWEEVKG